MNRYVCGFSFDEDRTLVHLIRKLKPKWQEGRLNGIGGKIEGTESPANAMVREYFEETGVATLKSAWELAVVLTDHVTFVVYFFRGHHCFDGVESKTAETVITVPVSSIPQQHCIGNLRWLIPLIADPQIKFPITVMEIHTEGEC